MSGRLLSYDPVTRIKRVFRAAPDEKDFQIETYQNVDEIVATNKAKYAAIDARARYGDMAQIASIPMPLYFELQRRKIIDPDGDVMDEKAFLRWLDDPANRDFRTRPGRLI